MIEEYLRICHVYAQGAWHDDARIVGTSSALAALSRAIGWVLSVLNDDPLSLRKHRVPVLAADGEGYDIVVERDDGGWDAESWKQRDLPYTEPIAQGILDPEMECERYRVKALSAEERVAVLEKALREMLANVRWHSDDEYCAGTHPSVKNGIESGECFMTAEMETAIRVAYAALGEPVPGEEPVG